MLFPLLSSEGQNLVRKIAELPNFVEVLQDALDQPSGLGVVGPRKPEDLRYAFCHRVCSQLLQGLEDGLLAAIPSGYGVALYGVVTPDEGQPPTREHG